LPLLFFKMKLKELMENVDYDDLVKLKSDLSSGAKHIKKILDKKILELEKKSKSCAVCGKPMMYGDNFYVLEFGPEDFKKKAHFCEIDCLEFFINHLKKRK